MNLNAPKYSTVSKASAFALMDVLRNRVALPNNSLRGARFGNNDHTLWVLESQASEEQYKEDPAFEVTRALVESARADYWYTHEKDYGTEEYDCDDSEDYEVVE